MKTLIFLFATTFLVVSSSLSAQEMDNRESFRFGLKIGSSYSNVYDSKSEAFTADAKFGFAGGAALNIPLSKYLGFQPEFLLVQKGFKGSDEFLGSSYSFTRTTTYIDVPFQIAVKPSEFFSIIAGPQYSYLLHQKDEFNSPFLNTTQEEAFDNENIRKNIFGFVVGVDVNISNVVVGARWGWDISTNHGDGSSSTPRYKNRWLMTTIGYSF